MHSSLIRFYRFAARQAKGVITAFEQALNEIERDPQDKAGKAKAAQTARLTPADIESIKPVMPVHYEDGRD